MRLLFMKRNSKNQPESLSSLAVTGLSCSSRGASNDRNFPTAAKKQVTFDSHQRVPGQFILINREWLIRRHSTGASIKARRHWQKKESKPSGFIVIISDHEWLFEIHLRFERCPNQRTRKSSKYRRQAEAIQDDKSWRKQSDCSAETTKRGLSHDC